MGGSNSKTVNHYAITADVVLSSLAPLSWDFQGSNDDSNWDTLHNVTNCVDWIASETRCFKNIGNVTSYRYYRLNDIKSNGVGSVNSFLYIAEWQLAETI